MPWGPIGSFLEVNRRIESDVSGSKKKEDHTGGGFGTVSVFRHSYEVEVGRKQKIVKQTVNIWTNRSLSFNPLF